jgi:hypothetical protein
MKKLGLTLIFLSFHHWPLTAVMIPILPISLATKTLLITGIFVLAQVIFGLGTLLVGKAVIRKYRQYLSFRKLLIILKRWRQTNHSKF